jgi:hypothetical protein
VNVAYKPLLQKPTLLYNFSVINKGGGSTNDNKRIWRKNKGIKKKNRS